MGLSFVKKAAGNKPAAATTPKTIAAPSGAGLSYLKRGNAARQALEHAEAQAELRKQEAGRLWRFWVAEGKEKRITFLDGDLDEAGMLDIPLYDEHAIRVNGSIEYFVCTAETDQTQPCPLCEAGDRPSLVGAMTIIDHSEHKVQKGPNAGKLIKNTRKLFVAKRNTIQILASLAAKRGGSLAGCTFDAMRQGDKSPNVGSQFDFVEKFESYDDIAEKYGLKLEDVQPANYEEEIRYRSPEELIALGLGKAVQSSSGVKKSSTGNLSQEL